MLARSVHASKTSSDARTFFSDEPRRISLASRPPSTPPLPRSQKQNLSMGRCFPKKGVSQPTLKTCGQPLLANKSAHCSEWAQTFTFHSDFKPKLSCAFSFFVLVHWSALSTDHLNELIQIRTEPLWNKRVFIEYFNLKAAVFYFYICLKNN